MCYKEVEEMLIESIKKITNLKTVEVDINKNLLEDDSPISLDDCIYLVKMWTCEFKFPIGKIVGKNNFRIFSIKNLAEAIVNELITA